MDRLTIASFPFPRDLMMVEARFQDEGIPYWLLDEHAHMVTAMGAGLGGVRVQVQHKDVGRAQLLLLEMGIHADEPDAPSLLVDRLDRHTRRLPVIGRWSLLVRLIILGLLFGTFLSVAVHLYYRRSPEELLTGTTWCLTLLEQDDVPVEVATRSHPGLALHLSGCEEPLYFNSGGTVHLPGVNTSAVIAHWELQGDRLLITEADALAELYEGVYAFHVDEGMLALRSHQLKLVAEAYDLTVPF